MRIFFGIAAGWVVLAAASAQENPAWQKTAVIKAQADLDQMLRGAKVIGIEGAIMGPAVKGAPYSAEEIHETTQVLADGTRIHNETKTTISRDSLGRVRRESPGQIMIWDGSTGTSYMLNQSSQTGQKMQMNYTVRHLGSDEVNVPFRTFQRPAGADAGPLEQQHVIVLKNLQATAEGKAELHVAVPKNARKEALGSQILEGVTCDGTRLTSTIEAGAIGNDRPIQSTEERWYSPDLQVDLMVRKADPRTGEDVLRLTNVRRIEPDPSLFTVPPGYQIK